MAQVTAKLNNLRMAPRKVRAVSSLIKGRNAIDALNQLEAMVKRSALPVLKLLNSAIANAENNHNMIRENLYVKGVRVDEGVKLKRFMPKGFGRVSPIQKKTSHIELILAEKVPGLKKKVEKQEKKSVEKFEDTKGINETIRDNKPEVKTELGKKEGILKGFGRRMFRRKSI